MDSEAVKHIVEASLLVAGRALSLAQLDALFEDDQDKPDRQMLRVALDALQQDYQGRGIELVEVASGFRLQSSVAMEPWIGRLFPERAPRYSRALLETLVLIAYRQPITRGEIEEVRGVAVSSTIVKTLQERDWVKVIGHKEVPGRPALLATTKEFLDYFSLKRLDDLPPLGELKDLGEIDSRLAEEIGLVTPGMQGAAANDALEVHGPPAPAWARQGTDTGSDTHTGTHTGTHAGTHTDTNTGSVSVLNEESESATKAVGQHPQDEGHSETQTELQRVIAKFAQEHRQQLDLQREAESGWSGDESGAKPARPSQTPADESPIENMPVDDLPTNSVLPGEAPVDDSLSDEARPDDTRLDDSPATGVPPDETPPNDTLH